MKLREQLLKTANAKTYIDLFAGCGGLSLGLKQAGWKGLFAIEKNDMAFETFSENFLKADAPYPHFTDWPDWLPKTSHGIEDILDNEHKRKELLKLRGKVALVAGGPPCQGFSVAGSRNGSDPRNQLVFKHLEFVKLVRPVCVLIENVEGFERRFVSRPGEKESKISVAEQAMLELETMGYHVGKRTINSADYGVPQLRKRVIIFAVSNEIISNINLDGLLSELLSDVSFQQRKDLDLPIDRYVNVEEAIHDLIGEEYVICPDAPKFNSCKYTEPKSNYAKLMRKGILDGEVPNSHRFSKHGEKVLNLYKAAHETQLPGRLKKDFLLSNNCKSDKKVLLNREVPSSTLTTHPDEFIHYKYPRNVTLREMARIQSFPDDFWFYGRYTLNGERRGLDVSRCAQIGNAIPPLMGKALGHTLSNLIEFIEEEKSLILNLSVPEAKFEQLILF